MGDVITPPCPKFNGGWRALMSNYIPLFNVGVITYAGLTNLC